MPVEFVVRLNDDGSMTWFGLSIDRGERNEDQDEHDKAVETIKAAMPGSTVVTDDPFAESSSTPDDPWTDNAPKSLADMIREANTHLGLSELWRKHRDEWTAEHNKLAAQRKKEIGK